MDSKKILLIGILCVAQSVIIAEVIHKERMISEDGSPIRCGTRWKNDGVMYKIFYETNGQATDETEQAGIMDVFSEEDLVTKDDSLPEQDPADPSISGRADSSPESDLSTKAVPSISSDAETSHETQRRVVYEYCLNEDTKLVMYTKYEIEKPELMKPSVPTYDRQGSVLQGPFEKQVSDMTLFTSISDTRKYYEKVIDYISQMVVIPDFTPDFQFNKKGFYKYDISAPLNVELKNPWKNVIQEIKKKIHKLTEPINVYSGTYDIYRLHGISAYLNPIERKMPIPFAWWILLCNLSGSRGISVIMQNFAFSPGEETNSLCSADLCSKVGLQIPKYNRANIYCCPAQTILEEYPFTRAPVEELFDFH